MKKTILPLLLLISFASSANITLPSIIGNNMVLQRRSAVNAWGWAAPGEIVHITTSWDNKTDSTVTTRDAKWMIQVNTPDAGGPFTITLRGWNTITLTNILIGEVWVCSGQSNMEWNYYLEKSQIVNDFPNVANPNIRLFQVPRATALYPQEDCKSQWTACDSNTVKQFSLVAYYFGKRINALGSVPVGLINTSWGGTPAEVWTPAGLINNNAVLKEANGKLSQDPHWPYLPGYTFNAMIAPFTNFAITGAIWYQGEGNTAAPSTYSELLNTMISSWRKEWKKDFPFYFVQIAPFTYGNNNVGNLIREQQEKSLKTPKTGMVLVSDLVDDSSNIHPKNKRDVGYRLASLALANRIRPDFLSSESPLFRSMIISGDKATIGFEYGDALMISGKTPTELFIAGNDQVFYPAEASIKDNKLVVWSNQVKSPIAVRYQFSNSGVGNLRTKSGNPVAPFRTDDWPVDTSAK